MAATQRVRRTTQASRPPSSIYTSLRAFCARSRAAARLSAPAESHRSSGADPAANSTSSAKSRLRTGKPPTRRSHGTTVARGAQGPPRSCAAPLRTSTSTAPAASSCAASAADRRFTLRAWRDRQARARLELTPASERAWPQAPARGAPGVARQRERCGKPDRDCGGEAEAEHLGVHAEQARPLRSGGPGSARGKRGRHAPQKRVQRRTGHAGDALDHGADGGGV
jgi:hypothetical protein